MDDDFRFPTRFKIWPYYGSALDEEQEAHKALEAAAASLLPGGAAQEDDTLRRRGPRRVREPQAEGD
ncbi:MAG TPA: hypothetical protein VEQ60_08085 [Longimicrobium sp.]|nr:hypothetical protein [Longimicrobium sp.]